VTDAVVILRPGRRQREDHRSDLRDGGIEVIHRLDDAIGEHARRHRTGDALQLQAGAEQLLDHVIVQVSGDPTPVLEHEHPFLCGPGPDYLEGEACLAGEVRRHLEVEGGEGMRTLHTTDREHAFGPAADHQRDRHGRSDAPPVAEGRLVGDSVVDETGLAALENAARKRRP
jgi:hypothetical protein